ncbi:hypothetical protein C8Q76DRAFT_763128 [Earliella scabrosa]|nr:hypothetical protein C8Q76DRAFT_763128 [Earliella scabrosa]
MPFIDVARRGVRAGCPGLFHLQISDGVRVDTVPQDPWGSSRRARGTQSRSRLPNHWSP